LGVVMCFTRKSPLLPIIAGSATAVGMFAVAVMLAQSLDRPTPKELTDQIAESARKIRAEATADAVAEIRRQIAEDPKFILDAVNAYMAREQARMAEERDRKAVANKAEIASLDGHPFVGNPDGGIQIVYFFDANCPYCKKMDPVLKRILAENPDVRIYHREIPILSETSRLAAQVANLVWEVHPGKYAEFHDRVLAHRGPLTEENVEDYLRIALGSEEVERLLARVSADDDAVQRANQRVKENLRVAENSGVTGTPFIYVLQGDGLLRGAGDDAYERVSELVARARKAAN